ncbi:MAG TPA: MFS transporter [Verrucomicrobiae bacterium]|jgi:MFS family permease
MRDTHNNSARWLNRTVLGIGLASLLCDWSQETATAILPAFLATMGAAAAWLGVIEGVSDGVSCFTKIGSGYFTDKLPRRKPVAVIGYLVTALGTASFSLAAAAWNVLLARSLACLGRGARTPVRKALLAGAVTRETYGRAFGFERMMDTAGAIAGPVTAFVLLTVFHRSYSTVFALTLIPGLAAAAVIAFAVKEKSRAPVPHISLGARWRLLPPAYRRFLAAVGLFGAGDCAPTLFILLAVQRLAPAHGTAKAASIAVALYVVRNIVYSICALAAGRLADRMAKTRLLAAGFFLAAVMAVGIIALPAAVWALVLIFVLAGVYVAMVETLEDSLCAELADEAHHGLAFGVLAAVNGAGDFVSSIIVGALWNAFGSRAAFAYCAVLFIAGALLAARIQTQSSSGGTD